MHKIFTIGHSTRKIEYFLDILKAHHIEIVVDVRTIPKSRRNPQYNKEELKETLKKAHIRYRHLPKLGGLRHATKESVNIGWHNLSFRGFADYMQTEAFWQGLESLEEIAKAHRTVIMCAEAVPWRCHRSLIADALTVHKWHVFHIQSKQPAKPHELTPFLTGEKNGVFVYGDEK